MRNCLGQVSRRECLRGGEGVGGDISIAFVNVERRSLLVGSPLASFQTLDCVRAEETG